MRGGIAFRRVYPAWAYTTLWKTTFNVSRPSMEYDLWWKTTFDGRRPLMEDDLWWRTNFNGRRPSLEQFRDSALPYTAVAVIFHKRLVFIINVCAARDILIFVVKNSGLLISIPLVRISNFCFLFNLEQFCIKYQPSGAGGTRSPPATPHRLQHLPAHFIQNGRCGLGIDQTLGYWTLRSTFDR